VRDNIQCGIEFQINGALTKKRVPIGIDRRNNTKRMLPCTGGIENVKGTER